MTQNGSEPEYDEISLLVTPDGTYRRLDVYPVGILRDVKISARRHKLHFRRYRLNLAGIVADAKQGDWHGVKTFFNGYLAELDPWPENMPRCGSGWTTRRAIKDLRRRCRKATW